MKTQDVLNYFDVTQAELAEFLTNKCPAIPIQQPSIANWGEYPPAMRQIQIQILTCGQLQAEPGIMPEKLSIYG